MQPDDRNIDALRDMQLYTRQVVTLVDGKQRVDLGEPITRLALERAVQIIGEAAGRVSLTFREAHPDIPWRQIVALRNILVHQYASIDMDTLWHVATERIPELLRQLEPLVSEPPGEEKGHS